MKEMKTYAVKLRHPVDQYAVTVTMSARDTTEAKAHVLSMHPGFEFVSVVLQQES